MNVSRRTSAVLADSATLLVAVIIYVIPFVFVFLTAAKTPAEAGLFQFNLPDHFQLLKNIREVVTFGDNKMLRALWNSTIITAGSIVIMIALASLVAVVLQRRSDRVASIAGAIMLAGLIIPPAVVPTVFLLQRLGLFTTLLSMILVDVAFNIPFAILILRAFVGTIPRELDEAAIVEGASPLRVFSSVLFPLLQPAIMTVVITATVAIFNDFVGPLYFLPGANNVTAPLTLFSFMSQFNSQWNLVFADVVVVTILPLIAFVFFQKQLVSGITSGAIKG
ncbi:MAG TPA: carbohydrate ABC transporter permease [Spirochaetia bacterium]|nr:carbohydrate ABC transporter permease [Spirochaetia bacterium]